MALPFPGRMCPCLPGDIVTCCPCSLLPHPTYHLPLPPCLYMVIPAQLVLPVPWEDALRSSLLCLTPIIYCHPLGDLFPTLTSTPPHSCITMVWLCPRMILCWVILPCLYTWRPTVCAPTMPYHSLAPATLAMPHLPILPPAFPL